MLVAHTSGTPTYRQAVVASGNNHAQVRPLVVAYATNTLNFDWGGHKKNAHIGVVLAVFNVTFKQLGVLPMGKKSLGDLRKKNPDFMTPPGRTLEQ